MDTKTDSMRENGGSIVDDTQSLIDSASDVVQEKATEARNRVSDAVSKAKDAYAVVQKNAVAGAKAADKVVRNNPYQTIGFAFALGALAGFLLSSRGKK